MGAYYVRYRFDPAATATFVEGSQDFLDFGDVGLSTLVYRDAPDLSSPPPPPATSITSITVAIQNASGSDHLMMDVAALTGFIVDGPPNDMTLSRWAFTSQGIPFPVPYATITGGLNGQPLVISLADTATQNGVGGTSDPGAVTPGAALLTLEALLDHILYRSDSNAPGPGKVITFSFGGSYAYGQSSVTLYVQESNSQPILANGAQAMLGTIGEHATNAFQGASFRQSHSDADGPNSGIAITAATANNGHWEYRIDGTSGWIALDAVSGSSSLLLKDTDWVRFVGDGSLVSGQNAGNTITYRIWDQFSGTAGSMVNTDSPNGQSPYSSSQASAALTIAGVNDAPVMPDATPALSAITEDQTQNGGQTVASFRGTIDDADPGALKGIAISGQAAGNGQWQYRLNGSHDWVSFGAVDAANALLLRDNDLVRFVPDGANGTSAALTYAAWDQTSGAAGGRANLAAAGATGGSTAFSATSHTANLTVSSVNDAPTANNLNQSLTIDEDTPTGALGIEVADVDADETITATLQVDNPSAALLGTAGGGSYDAGTGIWTITGGVGLVNAALAAVTFVPAPNATISTAITVQIRDAAGTGPDGAIFITVDPVNDAPTVTGATQTHAYTEGDPNVALDPITIADADDSDSVTVTVTLADPAAGVIASAGGTFAGGV